METGPKGCSAWRLGLRGVALGADLVVEEGALLEATSSVGLAGHPYLVGVKVESGEGEG